MKCHICKQEFEITELMNYGRGYECRACFYKEEVSQHGKVPEMRK